MNKTFALTRILLKNGTGPLSMSGNPLKRILIPIVLLAVLLSIGNAIRHLVMVIYDALQPIGQEGVVLSLGLGLATAIVFTFGIFFVISVFYFSQDVEQLLPLPIKPSQIVTAKFIQALLYEYMVLLVLVVPVVAVYGVKSGAGFLFWVYAVVIYAALPVVPLMAASFIAMIIMSFVTISRNKDRFRMFAGIAAILVSIGFNRFIQSSLNKSMSPERLQEMLLGGDNSLVHLTNSSFPNVRLAVNALLHPASLEGAAWLILFVGITALAYVVFVALAQRLYFKGAMGMSESSGRRIRISGSQLDKQTSQQSALMSLVTKEFRILLRTPAFFMNCVLLAVLWPFLMLIPYLSNPQFRTALGSIGELLNDSYWSGLVPAIGAGVLLVFAGMNAASATAISREGAGFFVLKYLPLRALTVIQAKVVTGWIITLFSSVLVLIVGVIAAKLPISFALSMLVLAVVATLLTSITGIMLDLWMPKLVWDNEQKAVKQNLNGLINLALSIIFGVALFLLIMWIGLSEWPAIALLFVLLLVIDGLLIRLLQKKGEAWFRNINA
ncbi:MAG: hypothetical protein K0Q59_5349 [Paenibacillus sp.]|jgi:ABC-2 type transport system permease protein|nr:hypothetical protein [Paenibacillus sp.]